MKRADEREWSKGERAELELANGKGIPVTVVRKGRRGYNGRRWMWVSAGSGEPFQVGEAHLRKVVPGGVVEAPLVQGI